MKILFEKPPIWDAVCSAFNIVPHNVVFTYGDTIYNPDKFNIPPDLIEHEMVHMEQQNNNETDAALWWGKFLRDPEFRVDQEAKAYGKQYKFILKMVKDREMQHRYLLSFVGSLSGPLYNNCIKQTEAMKLIKQYSK